MNTKTPVAFFTYNRPAHTQRALESLARCSRLNECEFYFFSDGPRTKDVQPQVDATRDILKDWVIRFNAQSIERNDNWGLAKSIVSGVTDLCERYGRVIVLEDDLIVGAGFLNYMLESLKRYENEMQVMQVGAFTISPPENIPTDVFLLPVTSTWGWATWQRSWRHFSWLPEDLNQAQLDPEWCRLFDLNGTCTFLSMLNDRLAGRNDSWGILWWYAVSRRRGLVAYPRESLVWNGGFDGSGVHCGTRDFTDQNAPSKLTSMCVEGSPTFPLKTLYDASHLAQLENFFLTQQGVKQSEKAGLCHKLTNFAKNVSKRVRNALY